MRRNTAERVNDMTFMEPTALAKQEQEDVLYLTRDTTKKVLAEIIDKYVEPQLLNLNVSWSDRLINSMMVYPQCCFNHSFTETGIWLSQYLKEYWENTAILVSNSLSPSAFLFRFHNGAYFSDVWSRSTLYLERELFITNETYDWLICFSELEHLLCYGGIVPWLKEKADFILGNDDIEVTWESTC